MTGFPAYAAWLIALVTFATASASAQDVLYRRHLNGPERRCLAQILEKGEWKYVPQTHEKMMSVAVVAETHLGSNNLKQYVYVMRDFSFCGTAGC